MHFARSDAEVLLQARALVPDLILLDLLMPEVDGFQAHGLEISDGHETASADLLREFFKRTHRQSRSWPAR